jgi:hypothetical protein
LAKIGIAPDKAKEMQGYYFRVTDQVPPQVWYWGALSSIVVSAAFFIAGKRDWSIFIGQWPPAFLLLGLFHKLLAPSG